jgi:UDP-glucose 4-epimerase
VLEVIETARAVTGRAIPLSFAPPRPGDPPRLVAEAGKARRVLDWKPAVPDLADIILSAWTWHLNHPEGYPRIPD